MIRVVLGRLRAMLFRLRGMRVGAKSSFGEHLHVRRPKGITVGTRVEIEHDVYLKLVDDAAHLELGDFVFIGAAAEIDVALSVRIGSHTLIAPGVFITDHEHNMRRDARVDAQGIAGAPVTVGADVWLGARSVVLAGVTIGDGAVIGAGAVVTRDVEPYTVVAGVPARAIGRRT